MPCASGAMLPVFQVVPPCGGHPTRACNVSSSKAFQVVPPCGGHHRIYRFRVKDHSFKSCPRVGGIQH